MHYYRLGDGLPVLLIHGLPTGGRLWDYVAEILASHFTLIAVDLPGFGKSPALPDDSLDADQFAQSLNELRGELSFPHWHVVGHDAGSTIAVHYAARFPSRVKKLGLCSPPIFPELQVPRVFRLIRVPGIGDSVAPIITTIMWRFGLYRLIEWRGVETREIVESFQEPFLGHRGVRHFVHVVRWGDPRVILARSEALLPSVSAPTLIIHGKQDGIIPIDFATRAAELIPDAHVELLDSSHFLPLNVPDAVGDLLLEFLDRQDIRPEIV